MHNIYNLNLWFYQWIDNTAFFLIDARNGIDVFKNNNYVELLKIQSLLRKMVS
jgi:hypothetical protein